MLLKLDLSLPAWSRVNAHGGQDLNPLSNHEAYGRGRITTVQVMLCWMLPFHHVPAVQFPALDLPGQTVDLDGSQAAEGESL